MFAAVTSTNFTCNGTGGNVPAIHLRHLQILLTVQQSMEGGGTIHVTSHLERIL